MTRTLAAWILLIATATAAHAQPKTKAKAPPAPEITYPPASAYKLAADDAKELLKLGKDPAHYRWLSAYHAQNAAELDEAWKLSSLVTNRLNFKGREIIHPVKIDGGRLLRIKICELFIDAAAWEFLGENGSGPVPFPEPYFHRTEQLPAKEQQMQRPIKGSAKWNGKEWQWQWETFTEKSPAKTITATSGVAVEHAKALFDLTGSNFPVFRWDWFCVYAPYGAAYIKFQGDPKDFNDILKLASVDPDYFKKRAVSLRGLALTSEVARHNRFGERVPSQHNYGRGRLLTSYDYLTSIRLNDLVKNVIKRERDAGEHIWTLPNGLDGYALTATQKDGVEKVVDAADTKVALDNRTKRKDKVVYLSSCQHCHASGAIPIADEIRFSSMAQLRLVAPDLFADGKRAEQVYDQYFGESINNLFITDNAYYTVAVKTATGEAAEAACLRLEDLLTNYLEIPITLDQAAREMGYPRAYFASVVDKIGRAGGIDHTFTRLLTERKARRDQFEVAFPQLQDLLIRAKLDGH